MNFRKGFIIFYTLLVFFQIKTTNMRQAYSFTPHQKDLMIKRMNMYPPGAARLGYILEAKKEVQMVSKMVENFFVTIDFEEYFSRRIPAILSPFLFIGLFSAVKEKRKLIIYSFGFSILIMTMVGSYGKYGPVLMLFYIWMFIFLGIHKLIRFRKK